MAKRQQSDRKSDASCQKVQKNQLLSVSLSELPARNSLKMAECSKSILSLSEVEARPSLSEHFRR
ncbi:hypothetical protein A2U01_0119309 [Trifolium medium]|uniref:Uncharacterized protein n=1 Tax=Trifolium medium TaxID=97028 RepID=A0A392WCX8_9FABA|nr:hypothetical protein [Trifolium medium]